MGIQVVEGNPLIQPPTLGGRFQRINEPQMAAPCRPAIDSRPIGRQRGERKVVVPPQVTQFDKALPPTGTLGKNDDAVDIGIAFEHAGRSEKDKNVNPSQGPCPP